MNEATESSGPQFLNYFLLFLGGVVVSLIVGYCIANFPKAASEQPEQGFKKAINTIIILIVIGTSLAGLASLFYFFSRQDLTDQIRKKVINTHS
jgi:F0F1-type ATP synthase membrane subunit c/vacuolar-type H+-ATPase subunit K